MNPIRAPSEAHQQVSSPESVASASAGGEDALVLRTAAALIDLAILFVVLVVLAATIGEASVEDGFSVYVDGAAAVLFFVLVFIYYFALEATSGRTVGKMLLGMRVVGADGGRPSAWAVGIRTVFRFVDWLPLLYLVGFVTTLATGSRRQRLGDLAAKTSVVRALAIRRRGLTAALVASGLVVAVVGSVVSVAVSAKADNAYRANGVSFDYPAGWQDVTDDSYSVGEVGGADELWTLSLGTAAFGADDVDMVTVTAYRMRGPVTAEDLDSTGVELTEMVLPAVGWAVQAGPEEITMGGKPGLRYEVTGSVGGKDVEGTLVYVFGDLTEYELRCQSTSEQAAEIEQGCEQIIRTFEISEPGAAEPPKDQPTTTQEVLAVREGEIIVQDDFSDSASGWGTAVWDEGEVGYVEGAYRIFAKQPELELWSDLEVLMVQGLRLEFEATQVAGTSGDVVGARCYTDVGSNAGYIVGIAPAEQGAFIAAFRGDDYRLLKSPGERVEAVRRPGEENQLRVQCVASPDAPIVLTLEVNGEALVRAEDVERTRGFDAVGFFVDTQEGGAEALFDDIVVTELVPK
jgi:uncharacterized RDD family membrane protein YckC